MAPVVHTPVAGFTGTVAGVNFADGVGESDDPAALLYFSGAGYEISDEVPPAGTPLTDEELARVAQAEAAGDSGQNPPSESDDAGGSDGNDAGDGGDAGTPPVTPDVPAPVEEKPDRPHPVQGSKADWFSYLSKIKPDHGFDLETSKRAELIAAANEVDGITAD